MNERHWSIIMADNIVIAQGYCWCDNPDGDYHSIGFKPRESRLDREFRHAMSRVLMLIELRASEAVSRLDHMHAIGTGVCGCGVSMETHPVWDNHSPVEIMMDKSYAED